MPKVIKLPDTLIDEAKRYAQIFSRSIPKQIEHRAKIGKIAEENPDLSYDFIKELLLGLEDARQGNVSEYVFDED